jgi:hypothetical protein
MDYAAEQAMELEALESILGDEKLRGELFLCSTSCPNVACPTRWQHHACGVVSALQKLAFSEALSPTVYMQRTRVLLLQVGVQSELYMP